MPQLPRFEIIPNDASTKFCAYVKQLEWLADECKQLMKLVQSSDYHLMCNCPHCKKVDELIEKIEKELER
jgi:hypothetical protein